MGYMFVLSPCFNCKTLISYNPERVPSIRVNRAGQPDPNGTREPVCRACIERANPVRIQNGLEPITILPGAYEPEEHP